MRIYGVVLVIICLTACDTIREVNWQPMAVQVRLYSESGVMPNTPVRLLADNTHQDDLGSAFMMQEYVMPRYLWWPAQTMDGARGILYTDTSGEVNVTLSPVNVWTLNGFGELGRSVRFQVVEPRSAIYCIFLWENPRIPTKVVKWSPDPDHRKPVAVDESECQASVAKPFGKAPRAEISLHPGSALSFPGVKEDLFYWEHAGLGKGWRIVEFDPSEEGEDSCD